MKYKIDIGAVVIKVEAPNIIKAIAIAVKKSKSNLSSVWKAEVID